MSEEASMVTPVTATQAQAVVQNDLGVHALSAERMTFGHNSITYEVALSEGGAVIVRTNTDPSVFAATEQNIAVLSRLGLPVPRILAADLSRTRFPFAYMILEKIPGRDLRYELPTMTQEQMTCLAEQIVDFQQRVATLPPGGGFGYVPIGHRGPFPTWKAFQGLAEGNDGDTSLDYKHPAPPEINELLAPYEARIARALRSPLLGDYLARVPPTCFLDDVTTKNVIVERGELRGLIDFDIVCYGDPLLMVGLTATAVVCDVGIKELFYVEELRRLWKLSAAQERAADLYSARMTIGFLRRLHAQETPEWRARMLTALERWVSRLDG